MEYIFTALPIRRKSAHPSHRQHPVKSMDIRCLILRIAGKLHIPFFHGRERASDTANANKTAVIKRIGTDMFSFNIGPDIFVRPINNRVANPPTFHTAVFKHSPVIVVVQQDSFFLVFMRFFKKCPPISPCCTLRPANAGGDKSICATIFFQNSAAITDKTGRWHKFLRNQTPHGHPTAFVSRHIDSTGNPFFLQTAESFTDMVNRFRRVGGSMIMNRFKGNPCTLRQF